MKIIFDSDVKEKIFACRKYLDDIIEKNERIIYGVNTGFGSLCNTIIPNEKLEQLQENLLLSHACGVGEELSEDIVKLMMILKIQSLSYGHSGVSFETVNLLAEMYFKNIFPVVYKQGSLGASGDLCPLAHLCLPLIGKGEVYYNNKKMNSLDALTAAGLQPVKLKAKEGLALINGTQFMSAVGCYIYILAEKIAELSAEIATASAVAFDCCVEPFLPHTHNIRSHEGQKYIAEKIHNIINGSDFYNRKKLQTQDPYSFRCIPQVHGASSDALKYVHDVFLKEINSVTDNPLIFPNDDLVISGGNFHGQPLALALDHMALAMHELGNISERRTFLLLSGQRGLPPFLTADAGLNSGFMIPQYTAASLVSLNKQLCTPSSADSITSSNGQEDHVSMGANAAIKAMDIIYNVEKIMAIEMLCAAQALDFRKEELFPDKISAIYSAFRKNIPHVKEDVYMHPLIANAIKFVEEWE